MTVTLHEDQHTFLTFLAQVHSECEIFQTKILEKIDKHILRSIIPPPPESHAVMSQLGEKKGKATDDNKAHAHCVLEN